MGGTDGLGVVVDYAKKKKQRGSTRTEKLDVTRRQLYYYYRYKASTPSNNDTFGDAGAY